MTLEEKVQIIREVLEEKKGEEIVALDLRGFSTVVDAFVLVSAHASVHAQAMADDLEKAAKDGGIPLWHVEGYREGRWILLDFGDVVVHIFLQEARAMYDLDRLWGDAPRLAFAGREE